MFIAALFTITKLWKQPKCPAIDEWIEQLWEESLSVGEVSKDFTREAEFGLNLKGWLGLEKPERTLRHLVYVI